MLLARIKTWLLATGLYILPDVLCCSYIHFPIAYNGKQRCISLLRQLRIQNPSPSIATHEDLLFYAQMFSHFYSWLLNKGSIKLRERGCRPLLDKWLRIRSSLRYKFQSELEIKTKKRIARRRRHGARTSQLGINTKSIHTQEFVYMQARFRNAIHYMYIL